MSEPKKQVFFLGAGFSKAVDSSYPLMAELSKQVEISIKSNQDTISEHYQREVPDLIKGNIEHLLTYLSTELPWKKEDYFIDKALYERISNIIQKKFLDLRINNELERYIVSFGDYLLGKGFRKDIITLNYDLLAERIIQKSFSENNEKIWDKIFTKGEEYSIYKLFYSYPFSWVGTRTLSSGNLFNTVNKINEKVELPVIIKLHGSANWFFAGETSSDILYYRNYNFNENDDMLLGLKPYIIPPVMDKNSFYNHIAIKYLWQKAHKLLSEADEIFIIGFSFPQTDISVRFLFQSALKENNSAKVYIVDIAEEEKIKINHEGLFRKGQANYQFTGNTQPSPLERLINEKLLPEMQEIIGEEP